MSAFDLRDWEDLSASLVSDCLDRSGVMEPAIRSLTGLRVCGPAFPVSTPAGENSTLHRAVAEAPSGVVLVVAAGGEARRAVWGEVLTTAARQVGILGLVLDGAIRDIVEIRLREFPVFARGSIAAGPFKGSEGSLGEPIECGGVKVEAGDVVLGDSDGVVVVPAARLAEVRAAAKSRADMERSWLKHIEAGESTMNVLGLE